MENENNVQRNVIVYNPRLNKAKRFMGFKNEFEQRAKNLNMEPVTFLTFLLEDLRHFYDKDYKKRIESMEIKGLDKKGIRDFSEYIKDLIRMYEKESKKKEMSDQKKEEEQELLDLWNTLKESLYNSTQDSDKLIEILKAKVVELQNDNSKKSKFLLKKVEEQIRIEENSKISREKKKNKVFSDIMSAAEEIAKKNSVSVSQCLRQLAKQLEEEEDELMNHEDRKEVLKRIDSSIYIKEVKHFTNDYSFLREGAFIAQGTTGVRRKFTDKKSYDRFYKLLKFFNGNKDEGNEIMDILKKQKLDDADREILEKRRDVILQRKNGLQLR